MGKNTTFARAFAASITAALLACMLAGTAWAAGSTSIIPVQDLVEGTGPQETNVLDFKGDAGSTVFITVEQGGTTTAKLLPHQLGHQQDAGTDKELVSSGTSADVFSLSFESAAELEAALDTGIVVTAYQDRSGKDGSAHTVAPVYATFDGDAGSRKLIGTVSSGATFAAPEVLHEGGQQYRLEAQSGDAPLTYKYVAYSASNTINGSIRYLDVMESQLLDSSTNIPGLESGESRTVAVPTLITEGQTVYRTLGIQSVTAKNPDATSFTVPVMKLDETAQALGHHVAVIRMVDEDGTTIATDKVYVRGPVTYTAPTTIYKQYAGDDSLAYELVGQQVLDLDATADGGADASQEVVVRYQAQSLKDREVEVRFLLHDGSQRADGSAQQRDLGTILKTVSKDDTVATPPETFTDAQGNSYLLVGSPSTCRYEYNSGAKPVVDVYYLPKGYSNTQAPYEVTVYYRNYFDRSLIDSETFVSDPEQAALVGGVTFTPPAEITKDGVTYVRLDGQDTIEHNYYAGVSNEANRTYTVYYRDRAQQLEQAPTITKLRPVYRDGGTGASGATDNGQQADGAAGGNPAPAGAGDAGATGGATTAAQLDANTTYSVADGGGADQTTTAPDGRDTLQERIDDDAVALASGAEGAVANGQQGTLLGNPYLAPVAGALAALAALALIAVLVRRNRRQARKIGHNAVAILVTLTLLFWQTPAPAFSAESEGLADALSLSSQAAEQEEPAAEEPASTQPAAEETPAEAEATPEPEAQPVEEEPAAVEPAAEEPSPAANEASEPDAAEAQGEAAEDEAEDPTATENEADENADAEEDEESDEADEEAADEDERNDQRSFTFENSAIKVVAKLTEPQALPKGVEFKVTPITASSDDYNYDAYLDALNAHANDDREYTAENTLLFDVAFMKDDVEQQLEEGKVSLSFEFKRDQLESVLDAEAGDQIEITHLPLSDKVRDSVDSTAQATDISARDIHVEDAMAQSASIEGETANFKLASLSAMAFTVLRAAAAEDAGAYTLTVDTTGADAAAMQGTHYYVHVYDTADPIGKQTLQKITAGTNQTYEFASFQNRDGNQFTDFDPAATYQAEFVAGNNGTTLALNGWQSDRYTAFGDGSVANGNTVSFSTTATSANLKLTESPKYTVRVDTSAADRAELDPALAGKTYYALLSKTGIDRNQQPATVYSLQKLDLSGNGGTAAFNHFWPEDRNDTTPNYYHEGDDIAVKVFTSSDSNLNLYDIFRNHGIDPQRANVITDGAITDGNHLNLAQDATSTTVALSALQKYCIDFDLAEADTARLTQHYYALASVTGPWGQNSKPAQRYALVPLPTDGTQSFTVDAFTDVDGANRTLWDEEEDVNVVLVASDAELSLQQAIVATGMRDGFLSQKHIVGIAPGEGATTISLKKLSDEAVDYTVSISFDAGKDDDTKLETLDNPAVTGESAVLVRLVSKTGNGSKQTVGWALKTIADTDLNDDADWEGSFDTFLACDGNGTPTGETLTYNQDDFTVSVRFYHKELGSFPTVGTTYTGTYSDAIADSTDWIYGYHFKSNTENDEHTQANLVMYQANQTEYQMAVEFDPAGMTPEPNAKYYLLATVDHQTSGTAYALAKVDMDAQDQRQVFTVGTTDEHQVKWGNADGTLRANEKFSGSETVKFQLVKYTPAQSDHELTIDKALSQDHCVVYDLGNTIGTSAYTLQQGPRSTETTEAGNGGVAVDTITDVVRLQKATATHDYDFKGILGGAVNYGITAENFHQANHIQTNFATNHFASENYAIEPDLAGAAGSIVIAERVDDCRIKIGQSHQGSQILLVMDGDRSDLDDYENRDYVTIVSEPAAVIQETIIDPMLDHMKAMSSELLQHPTTVTVSPEMMDGSVHLNIDLWDYPEDATIYLDGDSMASYLAQTSGVHLIMHPNQTIVFNFDSTSDVEIAKIEATYGRDSGSPHVSTEPETTKGQQNTELDALCRHLVFNLASATNVTLKSPGGIFLVPRADSSTDVVGTTSGWVVSAGTVYNPSGEWHSVYSDQADVDVAILNAGKQVDGAAPTSSQKFQFTFERYAPADGSDGTTGYQWQEVGTAVNNGATVSQQVNDLQPGWNIFRITETYPTGATTGPEGEVSYQAQPVSTDANGNPSYSYYAAVKYSLLPVTDSQGKQKYVAEPAKYFASFNEAGFNPEATTLNSLSQPVARPTFVNSTGEAMAELQLRGQKQLTGAKLAAGQFSATATEVALDANGNMAAFEPAEGKTAFRQTVRVDARGALTFDKLTFTEAGTHYYVVTEDIPDGALAYAADASGELLPASPQRSFANSGDNATSVDDRLKYTWKKDGFSYDSRIYLVKAEVSGSTEAGFSVAKEVTVYDGGEPQTYPADNVTFAFANSFSKQLEVQKVWEGGIAGTSTIQLYQYVKMPVYYTHTFEVKGEDLPAAGQITVSYNGESKLIAGPGYEPVTFQVKEGEQPEPHITFNGFIGTCDVAKPEAGDGDKTFTITATAADTEMTVPVSLEFAEGSTPAGNAAVNVTFTDTSDSSKTWLATLNAGNEWMSSVILPRLDADGKLLTYSVTAEPTGDESLTVTGAPSTISDKGSVELTGSTQTEPESGTMTLVVTIPKGSTVNLSTTLFASSGDQFNDWGEMKQISTGMTNTWIQGPQTITVKDLPLEKESGEHLNYCLWVFQGPGPFASATSNATGNAFTRDGAAYYYVNAQPGVVTVELTNAKTPSFTTTSSSKSANTAKMRVAKASLQMQGAETIEDEPPALTATPAPGTSFYDSAVAGASGTTPFETVTGKQLPAEATPVGSVKTITGDGSAIWENLPEQDEDGNPIYYYVVETNATAEADAMSVAYSYEYNEAGKPESGVKKVTITNSATKQEQHETSGTATIQAAKAVEGATWPTNAEGNALPVTFTLAAAGDTPEAPLPSTTSIEATSTAPVSFPELSLGEADAGKTYHYTVTESAAWPEGWSCANTSFDVTVEVGQPDDEGKLTAEVSYGTGRNTITNTYQAYNASGSITFAGTKTFDHGTFDPENPFAFDVVEVDAAGEPIADKAWEATADENGAINFPTTAYGLEDVGVHTYQVSERLPKGVTAESPTKDGISYDTTVHTVTVTVSDEPHNGQLAVSASDNATSLGFTNTYVGETQVSVSKAWVNADGSTTWPQGVDSIEVALMNGATQVATHALTSEQPQYTFEGLPKLDADGNEIAYTVTEPEAPAGYYGVVSGSAETGFTITNSQAASELQVTKSFTGREWKDADIFTFTLAPEGDAPVPDGTEGGTATATATVSNHVAAFGPITYDKPGEYHYTITETKGDLPGVSYDTAPRTATVEVSVDSTTHALVASVSYGESSSLEVTNSFTAATAHLEASKQFNDWGKASSFEFVLEAVDDAPMPEGTVDGKVSERVTEDAKTANFGDISYFAPGTYEYTITETDDGIDGVTYDTTPHKATVTITQAKDDNHLEAQVVYDDDQDALTIVNSFASATAQLQVTKALEKRGWKDGDAFEFELAAVDGAPLPDGTEGNTATTTATAANHVAAFDAIHYDQAGTYEYTITETRGNLGGVTYDITPHKATVEVTKGENNQLAAQVSYDSDKDSLNVTNTYDASGSFTVKGTKLVTKAGQAASDDYSKFTFTLEGAGIEEALTAKPDAATGEFSFAPLSYTLDQAGTAASPKTYTYTLYEAKETVPVGYTSAKPIEFKVSVWDEGDGELQVTSTMPEAGFEVTNAYDAAGKTTIEGSKSVTGRAFHEGDSATMKIEAKTSGAPLPTIEQNGETVVQDTVTISPTEGTTASFGFAPIRYRLADLDGQTSKTFEYKVTESAYSMQGVGEKDSTEHTVSIKVTDAGDGTLTIEKAGDGASLYFVNSYDAAGSITLTGAKTFTRGKLSEGQFTFKVYGEGSDEPVSTGTVKADGTIAFSPITYKLEDLGGESEKTFTYEVREDIPAAATADNDYTVDGITYDTSEKTVKVTVTDNGTGALATAIASESDSLEFANKYSAQGQTTLTGTKHIANRTFAAGDQATISIQSKTAGAPLPAPAQVAVNPTAGQTDAAYEFAPIVFTLDNIPEGKDSATFDYTVTESESSMPGVAKDESSYDVSIEVRDAGNGTLEVTATDNAQHLDFTNTYDAKGSIGLEGTKTLENGKLTDGQFTFQVFEKGSDTPVATGTNDAKGTIAFSSIDYTLEQLGGAHEKTFTYEVREVLPEAATASNGYTVGGVTYDAGVRDIQVTVTDNGRGTLEAKLREGDAEKLAFTNTYDANGSFTLKGHKDFKNDKIKAGQFRFEAVDVTAGDDTADPAKFIGSADDNGNIGITFSYQLADLNGAHEKTFHYKVREQMPETATEDNQYTVDGVTYDSDVYDVAIKVVDTGAGTLEVSYVDAESQELIFENAYNATGQIVLGGTKHIDNRAFHDGDRVSFLVTAKAEDGGPLPQVDGQDQPTVSIEPTSGTEANYAFAPIVFTQADLGGLEKKTFHYVVTESGYDMAGVITDPASVQHTVAVTVSDAKHNGQLEISSTDDVSALDFTNTYNATGGISLEGTKVLEGGALEDGAFAFEVKEGDTLVATGTSQSDGTIAFKPANTAASSTGAEAAPYTIDYTLDDVGVHTYTAREILPEGVTEDEPLADGVVYDTAERTFTVTVADKGDGNLEATADYGSEDGLNFANKATATAQLSFGKQLFGAASGSFQLGLLPLGQAEPGDEPAGLMSLAGGSLESATTDEALVRTVNAGGSASFDLEFTEPGAYFYVAYELNDGQEGMLYDDARYLVRVDVAIGADGLISATPSYELLYPDADGTYQNLGATDDLTFYNNATATMDLLFMPMAMAGYEAKAERASLYPEVAKTVNGDTAMLQPGAFAFRLAGADDSTKGFERIATNDERGMVAFFDEDALDDWGLVYDAPGEYRYTISEVVPSAENADPLMSYDESRFTLMVNVVEADGALQATATYLDGAGKVVEGTPTFNNERETMDLRVQKRSRYGGEGLAECTYALLMVGPTGDVMLTEGTSDDTGYIMMKDVTLIPGQKYYFKEVEAPDGHTVDPYRTAYFTLSEDRTTTVLVEDTAEDGWHSKYDNIWLDQAKESEGE